MFTQHLEDNSPGVSKYGVGIMLPSHLIWAAVMTDEMQDERRKWDEMNKKSEEKASGPKPKGVSTTQVANEEFERFEDLTRQLAHTPKPDAKKQKDAS